MITRIISTTLISVVLLAKLLAQPNIDSLQQNADLYKRYAAVNNHVDYTSNWYLAIVPPMFEGFLDTIKEVRREYRDMLQQFTNETVIVKPEAELWMITFTEDALAQKCMNMHKIEAKEFIILSKLKLRGRYGYFTAADVSADLDSIYNVEKVITRYRKVSDGRLVIISKNEKDKYPNAVLYSFSQGDWQSFEEVACPMGANDRTIGGIQAALKIRGYYKGEITGVLESTTKAALVKFQKDHNWPQCGIVNSYRLLEKILSLE